MASSKTSMFNMFHLCDENRAKIKRHSSAKIVIMCQYFHSHFTISPSTNKPLRVKIKLYETKPLHYLSLTSLSLALNKKLRDSAIVKQIVKIRMG